MSVRVSNSWMTVVLPVPAGPIRISHATAGEAIQRYRFFVAGTLFVDVPFVHRTEFLVHQSAPIALNRIWRVLKAIANGCWSAVSELRHIGPVVSPIFSLRR